MFTRSLNPSIAKRQQTPIRQISADRLQAKLNDGHLFLLDVRSPLEFEREGHIKGARLLPLPMLRQRRRELPRDRTIVCVCRSGNRSLVACEELARAGFDVVNLRGGLLAWKAAGYPLQ